MASDFIKEKIKDKPLDKKKLLKKAAVVVVTAVIFGAVSAASFAFVYSRINPGSLDEVKPVELTASEKEPEGAVSDNMVSDDSAVESESVSVDKIAVSEDAADAAEALDDTASGNDAPADESASDNAANAAVSDNKSPTTIINNINNQVDISPQSYTALYKALHEIAADAETAVVEVTAKTTSTDWFERAYEDGDTTAGLIIADNGKQMLILADGAVTGDAESIEVRFDDDTSAPATIVKSDVDTSLQILGVDLTELSEQTKNRISYAKLGTSTYASTVGTPVIAIGAPLGMQGSEAYGLITSMTQQIETSDFNFHLLTTDIYGSENASGVIIDYSGRVLGIITTAYQTKGTQNIITTYSISDIKDMIESLANGKDRAYLGINGTSVTADAAEEYNIPKGAYVINVEAGSPAMTSGIQSGDVITRIGTEVIADYPDYMNAIKDLSPGVSTVITVQRFSRGDYSELTFDVELSNKEQ